MLHASSESSATRHRPQPPDPAQAQPPLESRVLAWDRKRKAFGPGDVIHHQGDPVSRAYLIRGGLVKLLSYLPNGRVRIVRLHTRGAWLGLEGLLGHPHEHSAVAYDHVEVEHCSVAGLQRLQLEEPDMMNQVLAQWHRNLVEADRWIAEFSTGAITLRVARLLEYLAELDGHQPEGQLELMRVHDVADILGVTPESVSRILAAFKRNQVLRRAPEPEAEVYQLDDGRLHEEVRRMGEEL